VFGGRGTSTLVVGGGVGVRVDVTALSYSNYGVAGNFVARDDLRVFVVVPGVHDLGLYQRHGWLAFVVTDAGRVDYDAGLDGVFGGRGSARLVVGGGVPVRVDVTALSYTHYSVAGNFTVRDQSPEFVLVPGAHALALNGRHGWLDIVVTDAGRVDYDAAQESMFSGRGTTTLVVRGGVHVGVDITATSYTGYSVAGNFTVRDQLPEFVLVPGIHALQLEGRPGWLDFVVTTAGHVDYDAARESIFSGRGGTTLTVRGLAINIDARSAEFVSFFVPGVSGWVDARQEHSFLLVNGTHSVVPSTGTTVTFTVTATGNVDYDASLDNILDGRGTPTLLFRGSIMSGPMFALIPAMPSLVRTLTRSRRAAVRLQLK
jgi:hypothetical protein